MTQPAGWIVPRAGMPQPGACVQRRRTASVRQIEAFIEISGDCTLVHGHDTIIARIDGPRVRQDNPICTLATRSGDRQGALCRLGNTSTYSTPLIGE